MRELRTCPVSGVQVLLNDGWVDRPSLAPRSRSCWYCADRGPLIAGAGPVRVVPHPEPALGVEGDAKLRREPFLARDAVGAHELVYAGHDGEDTPLLEMVVHRMSDLRQDSRLRGFRATRRHRRGEHVAWQLFALPFDVAPAAPGAWRDEELARGLRVIRRGPAAAIAAWAPRVPFETWIVPEGQADFPAGLPAMTVALRNILELLDDALDHPPIDVVIEEGFPWRFVLLPQLGVPRPVEVATGLPMHGVFPEEAARFLRRR